MWQIFKVTAYLMSAIEWRGSFIVAAYSVVVLLSGHVR